MPVAAIVHQLIQGLVGRGYGDVDFAAFIAQAAESAGMALDSEQADVADGLDLPRSLPGRTAEQRPARGVIR